MSPAIAPRRPRCIGRRAFCGASLGFLAGGLPVRANQDDGSAGQSSSPRAGLDTDNNPTFPLGKEVVYSDQFLDSLSASEGALLDTLYDPANGGYWLNHATGANAISSVCAVFLRYATGNNPSAGKFLPARINYLESLQDPVTGRITPPSGPEGQGETPGDLFWATVRALNLLGGTLRYSPEFNRSTTTPAGLESWFERQDWESNRAAHHDVLALLPIIASLDDRGLTKVFFTEIAKQQNANTGCWPKGEINVSRTFAYTLMYIACGRLPPRPEKIMDSILRKQDAAGIWDDWDSLEFPRFATMDAAYLLVRLPPRIAYREAEARDALGQLSANIRNLFLRHQSSYVNSLPSLMQVTHLLGLLQEFSPQDFPSTLKFRFGWDDLNIYRCAAIGRLTGAAAMRMPHTDGPAVLSFAG